MGGRKHRDALRNATVLGALALVVALPFVFQRPAPVAVWHEDDPVVVAITPHNEAIRHEFGQAFSVWHARRFGRPAKVDWRVVGGTAEIMRYLESKFVSAFRAWWTEQGERWPVGGGDMILDRRFRPSDAPPEEDAEATARHALKTRMHSAFRSHNAASAFGSRVDVLFGGGVFEHERAAGAGLTVPAWTGDPPEHLFETPDGRTLIPVELSGEKWRGATYYGACLSAFGIVYNIDRLSDLGIERPPERWADLQDPRYFGHIGVADPTKSGSIAKAFEMIVHEQMALEVAEAGFTSEEVAAYEQAIGAARLPPGQHPADVPEAYQKAVERGWLRGIWLVQKIGANARYFTDGAGRVPVDVSAGSAAAGLCIDFFGRFQEEQTRTRAGLARIRYITPRGGSSVSADPISVLRGAPHQETAARFVEFVLGVEGQQLWNQRPGTPGGPLRYALRRLPIRRDFYPPAPDMPRTSYERYAEWNADRLGDPDVNPYALASEFVYHPRWTLRLFSQHRKLIRAMCLDSADELRAAWGAIIRAGGPAARPEAVALMERLPQRPVPLDWVSMHTVFGEGRHEMDIMREWTLFFRQSYREAARSAEERR